MKKFRALTFVSAICLLTQNGYAQKILLHPYIGGSLNFWGVSSPGWGIDGGMKFRVFYAGLEYGTYGHEVTTVSLPSDESYHPIFEDYYGVHGGIVIDSIAYLGLVFLRSYAHDVVGGVSPWFNVGPDVRFQTGPHFVFAGAYTIRRGLNAGINFLF